MNFKKSILYIFFSIFILSQSSAEDTKNKDFKIFPGEWETNCSTSTTDNQKICLLQRSMFVDKDLKFSDFFNLISLIEPNISCKTFNNLPVDICLI